MWIVENSGKKDAVFLMEKDKKILMSLKENDLPILHFYDFEKPSFTHGVFVKPELVMGESYKEFDFSKRPTGGGVLFHVWDFAFSCFVPKNHAGYFDDVMECYKYVNQKVINALSVVVGSKEGFSLLPEEPVPMDDNCKNFCFAKPTKYDIMFEGKKLAGAAQRRKGGGYLHQGSVSLISPDFERLAPLFEGSKVLAAMKKYTHPLFGNSETLDTIKQDIQEQMIVEFNKI